MATRSTGTGKSQKTPSPIDKHVGSRVRMQRMLVGLSQGTLGDALGLTFQQVQKYEKGTNRIGASRLHDIARVLGVPISFFYDGAPRSEGGGSGKARASGSSPVSDFLLTRDGVELVKGFLAITDPQVRRRLIDLVHALADDDRKERRAA